MVIGFVQRPREPSVRGHCRPRPCPGGSRVTSDLVDLSLSGNAYHPPVRPGANRGGCVSGPGERLSIVTSAPPVANLSVLPMGGSQDDGLLEATIDIPVEGAN